MYELHLFFYFVCITIDAYRYYNRRPHVRTRFNYNDSRDGDRIYVLDNYGYRHAHYPFCYKECG